MEVTNRMKKFVSLALVGAMSLSLLSSCGGDTTESAAPTKSSAPSESAAPAESAAPNDSAAPAESGAPAESAAPSSGGAFNLNVNIASEPESIDPAKNTSADGNVMIQHMMEGLMTWKSSGEKVEGVDNADLASLEYGQAEKYEKTANDDGSVTYVFHLRDGIKWTDGKDVTAADFVYAWQRLVNPETTADYCYMISMVKGYDGVNGGLNAEGVPLTATELAEGATPASYADPSTLGIQALDEKTLQIDLTYDCPYFLEMCAFPSTYPVRQDVIEAKGDQWTQSPETYLTNGAYRMTKWEHNSEIIMEKNPEYYDVATLGPDTITFKLMDNNNAMLTAFQAGDLDFIEDMPVDEIPTLMTEGSLNIVPQTSIYYISYNVEEAPFDDWRVRKAFTLAINSQYIVDNVTQTGQVPATGFVPAGVTVSGTNTEFRTEGGDYWTAPTTDEQYEKNCEEARKLLEDAGYPNGEGLPSITYLYNTSDNHKKIGEALQQQWKSALGVEVKLENQDWNVFLANRKAGNYQVCRNGWNADYNDPITFLDMWVTGGGNNDAQYSSAEYDAAIEEAGSSADPTVRSKAMHKAEDILLEKDWVLGPIYFYTMKYMLADGIQGLYYKPTGQFFFKYCTKG